MNWALLKKNLIDAAVLFLACALAASLFAWFRVWIVGELDATRFQRIIELLPQTWRRLSPVDFEWMITYTGRTALTLNEPMLVMVVAIWCIVRGSDVVSGEINRGTMELLLAQPLSRMQIYWHHAFVTLLGVVLLVGLIWGGMWIGLQTRSVEETIYPSLRIPGIGLEFPVTFLPPRTQVVQLADRISALEYLPGILKLLALGVFLTGISAFCSSWDRYRWRTLGIVIGFYMVSAMLKILGLASETFRWTLWLTFFSSYEPEVAIKRIGVDSSMWWQVLLYDSDGYVSGVAPIGGMIVLFSLGIAAYVVGAIVFNRRDIPAPV